MARADASGASSSGTGLAGFVGQMLPSANASHSSTSSAACWIDTAGAQVQSKVITVCTAHGWRNTSAVPMLTLNGASPWMLGVAHFVRSGMPRFSSLITYELPSWSGIRFERSTQDSQKK